MGSVEKSYAESEMLGISELADRVGMSVSSAHRYVRRYREMLHPVQSKRGNLYPPSDVTILCELYGQSSRQPEPSEIESTSTEPEAPTQNTGVHNEIETAGAMIEQLKQLEKRLLETVEGLNVRYRMLCDQFDHFNRVIVRSWETQQAFVEHMNESIDRAKQQDRIITMLMDRTDSLERERTRFMELAKAYEEAAVSPPPVAKQPSPTSTRSAAVKEGSLFRKIFGN